MLIFLAKHLQKILGPAMATQLLRMSYTKAFYTGKYLKQKDLMYSISVWFCSTSEIKSEDDYKRWWWRWRIEDYGVKETRQFGGKKRKLSNHQVKSLETIFEVDKQILKLINKYCFV